MRNKTSMLKNWKNTDFIKQYIQRKKQIHKKTKKYSVLTSVEASFYAIIKNFG